MQNFDFIALKAAFKYSNYQKRKYNIIRYITMNNITLSTVPHLSYNYAHIYFTFVAFKRQQYEGRVAVLVSQ